MIFGEVKGVGNVASLLNKTLPKEVEKELVSAVKAEARTIYSIGQANAPVASGQLKGELKIKSGGKGLIARIGIFRSPTRGYVARFLEFGVARHIIQPKNRKALAIGGKFANSVEHPGIKARHWLLGASNGERTNFQARIREAMLSALRKVNKS